MNGFLICPVRGVDPELSRGHIGGIEGHSHAPSASLAICRAYILSKGE